MLSLTLQSGPLSRLRVYDGPVPRQPLTAVAALIDALSHLQAIALRGNPCLTKNAARGRLQLLGLIRSLRVHGCCLRIVDTPISVDERVSAWIKNGEKEVRVRVGACVCVRVCACVVA